MSTMREMLSLKYEGNMVKMENVSPTNIILITEILWQLYTYGLFELS